MLSGISRTKFIFMDKDQRCCKQYILFRYGEINMICYNTKISPIILPKFGTKGHIVGYKHFLNDLGIQAKIYGWKRIELRKNKSSKPRSKVFFILSSIPMQKGIYEHKGNSNRDLVLIVALIELLPGQPNINQLSVWIISKSQVIKASFVRGPIPSHLVNVSHDIKHMCEEQSISIYLSI